MSKDIGVLHFTGIGGIGMSGIAEILLSLGYQVQGSDLAANANVKRLRDKSVQVYVGHDGAHIKGAVVVVVSSAVKQDNPEVVAARAAGIPVIRRAEMLAELMRMKSAIAVGGTHGKTTTTAMIGHMMEVGGKDPTVINGGIVNAYGTNARLGQSHVMVVEADESDGTFTRLPASVAVVTNMDAEHMDHYSSFDDVRDAYRRFIKNVPFHGYAVLCSDHAEVQGLISSIKDRRIITYGFNPQADIRASHVRISATGNQFDVRIAGWLCPDGQDIVIKDMSLPMLGEHNVQNSLVAIAVAQQSGIAVPLMRKALESFSGVQRRFTRVGDVSGTVIIDDYAHHPVEIETVLKTARTAVNGGGGRVIAVMQPHRYTRLRDLFDEFCTCFNNADQVLILPVYEAGETPIDGVDGAALAAGIAEHGHKHVRAIAVDALATDLAQIMRNGDMVVCLGAGDITAMARQLPDDLATIMESKVA
jgi:UDP-N-acetylmuramate--alanine ligase